MRTRFFSLFDYILFFSTLFLTIIGICFIYSSGLNSEHVLVSKEYIKQIIWAATGIVILIAFSLLDYRRAYRICPYLFIGILVILIYTRIFGRYVNGAKSWIGFKTVGVQPSEFGKIIFILFLAWFLERSTNEEPRKRFIVALLIMICPIMLILLQPDLGTASVYIPIFLIMCYFAGIPLRFLMMCLLTGLLTIIFAVLPIWEVYILQKDVKFLNIITENRLRFILIAACALLTIGALFGNFFFGKKYYYWIAYAFGIITFSLLFSIVLGKILKDYQIMRLIVFINPEVDEKGAGWNIIQSKIAIGSGNFWGLGYLKGTQSHYRFLPQQSTDFIFSILSEEWGFAGGFLVFLLYFALIFEGFSIIRRTNDVFGSYIACGVSGMFFYHFIINVGMVMGIMPITGIPLLFLSYGGSSLWTAMMGIGLLQSIALRRFEFH